MLKYFQKQKDLIRQVETLSQVVKEKNTAISKLLSNVGPEQVVEKVLGGNISFYPYEKLDFNSQKDYYVDAQAVLNNEVFKNEVNHLITDWVEFIAYKSPDHKTTRNIRMSINALELLKTRLKNISDPEKQTSTEDLYSAV